MGLKKSKALFEKELELKTLLNKADTTFINRRIREIE